MGYTTRFQGTFKVTPAITQADLLEYENNWALSVGDNTPNSYNQWELTNASELEWDGEEKFYEYIPWLLYLVDFFFEPRGYKLNGDVVWSGEAPADVGVIRAVDNRVFAHAGVTSVPVMRDLPQGYFRSRVIVHGASEALFLDTGLPLLSVGMCLTLNAVEGKVHGVNFNANTGMQRVMVSSEFDIGTLLRAGWRRVEAL